MNVEHRPPAWVTAVVVVWGHFPETFIEHENVTYISGEKLAAWIGKGTI